MIKYSWERFIKQSILKSDNNKEYLKSIFDAMITSCNTQRNEWLLDELIEESMKKVKSNNVQFVASTESTKDKKVGKVVKHLNPKKKFIKDNYKYRKRYNHKVNDYKLLKKKKHERQDTFFWL
ncbi:hypothetical protein CR513_35643, partial [Mucuna pruriens]